MLLELQVRNMAVVAEAAVELRPGLNALTGETGAGKSIVVDSLALLSGARASAELIRTGAEGLTVTGVFAPAGDDWRETLAAAGIEAEGEELLVRREVSRTGRNRVYLNDRPTTLRLLSELAPALLRIHGQREELGLATPDLQRVWLDRCGAPRSTELSERVAAAYDRWAELASRLERLVGDERARLERLDLLRLQAGEIDAARLVAGEDEELAEERSALRHREAITGALEGSLRLLVDDEAAAAARAARARDLLTEIAGWESAAKSWADELEEARIRIQEVASDARHRLDSMDPDPARLDVVETRLAEIERLRRKHAGSVSEILERRAEIGRELEELETDAAGREELAGQMAEALAEYRSAALALSAARREWGETLARGVEQELADLGMAKASLTVQLARRRRSESPLEVDGERVDFGREGLDHVVFELAANPGEAPRPLGKIASGGELSRIYLALQVAVAGAADSVESAAPTLVFDEVDTGVGGAEAAALGRKLARLGTAGQVLAVTHLAPVASCADSHFKVTKQESGGRTWTTVDRLEDENRVEEVSRMLAGDRITDTAREHARELLAVDGQSR